MLRLIPGINTCLQDTPACSLISSPKPDSLAQPETPLLSPQSLSLGSDLTITLDKWPCMWPYAFVMVTSPSHTCSPLFIHLPFYLLHLPLPSALPCLALPAFALTSFLPPCLPPVLCLLACTHTLPHILHTTPHPFLPALSCILPLPACTHTPHHLPFHTTHSLPFPSLSTFPFPFIFPLLPLDTYLRLRRACVCGG